MECPICLQANEETVHCPHCHKKACLGCTIKFLETDAMEAQCMHCRHPWTTTFFYHAVPCHRWSTALRKRRMEWMVQLEKSRLVQAQEALEYYDRADALEKQHREQVQLLNEMQIELARTQRRAANMVSMGNHTLEPDVYHAPAPMDLDEPGPSEIAPKTEPSKTPPMPCPMSECRGFVVHGKCGVCHAKICKRCMCPEEDDHECDEDQVKTVESFRRNTKRCPNCSALSQKMDGCSQVFCWSCKRSWIWNTGTLVQEGSWQHSPDYYQYVRSTRGQVPRAPGDGGPNDPNPAVEDNPCALGFFATAQRFVFLVEACARFRNGTSNLSVERFLRRVHRITGEFQDTITNDPLQQRNNGDLRIKFLRREIDEHKWKLELAKREKKLAYDQDVLEWKRAYVESTLEFMRDILQLHQGKPQFNLHLCQDSLVRYGKFVAMMFEEFERIKTTYGSRRTNGIQPVLDQWHAVVHHLA